MQPNDTKHQTNAPKPAVQMPTFGSALGQKASTGAAFGTGFQPSKQDKPLGFGSKLGQPPTQTFTGFSQAAKPLQPGFGPPQAASPVQASKTFTGFGSALSTQPQAKPVSKPVEKKPIPQSIAGTTFKPA